MENCVHVDLTDGSVIGFMKRTAPIIEHEGFYKSSAKGYEESGPNIIYPVPLNSRGSHHNL